MKRIKNILFSMTTSVILLVIFGTSIGYATFAESSSGTDYAKEIVYGAFWFEILLTLLIVNLVGSVFHYQIFNKRKFSILLFHFAFICILIGAGITRYFGYEGIMHIRQGETSNEISTEKSSVKISAEYNGERVEELKEANFSENSSNDFSKSISIANKTITVETEMFLPNSIETIVPDEQGQPALSLFVMNQQNQGMDFILLAGETNSISNTTFSFQDSTKNADITFSIINNQLYFKCKMLVTTMGMMQKTEETLKSNMNNPVQQKTIYKTDNLIFVLKSFLPKATKTLTQLTPEMNNMGMIKQGKNALVFKVSDGDKSKLVNVLSNQNQESQPVNFKFDDINMTLSYGMLSYKLPFSITLREFELERYPGSNSPSSYASEITVTDNELKTERPFRIYMNNILNYRGYRFFQSSYDQDERGTILSVNHDYWGTFITYIGYFLMTLGMILTLFNKNSRFRMLIKQSDNLQQKRKATKTLLMVGILASSGSLFAAGNHTTKKDHIEELNSLLIQDEIQGRIEPICTYSSDLLRKISKKTSYNDQSSLEVLLGMVTNPSKWSNEPIIKVAHAELAKELGSTTDHVTYNQLFDFENGGQYKLSGKVEKAYQKNPSERNQYEKELINLDERLNICDRIFAGNILTIFPELGHQNQPWKAVTSFYSNPTSESSMKGMESSVCPASGMSVHPEMSMSKDEINGDNIDNTEAKCPVSGMSGKTMGTSEEEENNNAGTANAMSASQMAMSSMLMSSMGNDNIANNPEKLLSSYFNAVLQAEESGDWTFVNNVLSSIKSYQLLNGGPLLPTKNKIKFEVLYNKISIFLTLAILYGLLGIILIALHLFNILSHNPKIEKYLDISFFPLLLMFVFYSGGLAWRWYISEHAPWSNGYESMIFVGWAAAFSGVVFARRSPITLAITSLLSAIALSVAGMSWMNPEITNLVPVLKSYWLVIHVAVITSSYGFFAMSSMLGLFNLTLMITRTQKNKKRLNESIQEFSYIVELSLIVGIFLLTIGTFIGGVWANESWGRYWGWDSKETWALVSILVYSAIIHLRNIPKLNNTFTLNSLSLVAFGTIIMTYFGVNYYLSGMHSYGQGTPPPIPSGVYISVIIIVGLILGAYNSEKKHRETTN